MHKVVACVRATAYTVASFAPELRQLCTSVTTPRQLATGVECSHPQVNASQSGCCDPPWAVDAVAPFARAEAIACDEQGTPRVSPVV